MRGPLRELARRRVAVWGVCIWGLLSDLLPVEAAARSVSPWTWQSLQGLTQQSDTIFLGRLQSFQAGDRSLPDGKGVGQVTVTEVFVGDRKLAGTTIAIEHSAGDQPLALADGPRLYFAARAGDRYRLSFFHTYGVLPITGDSLAIWLEGKPPGSFYSLADVLTRVRRDAQARVVWSAELPNTLDKMQQALRVDFTARNEGPAPVQVLLPSHFFDALWARRVLADGKKLADDWQGVGHWDHHKPVEGVRSLAPGAVLHLHYAIPRAVLGMSAPGVYRVGVRLEAHRLTQVGDRVLQRAASQRIWLGGLDHFFVDVTVD